jgi:hypothetical protein
MLRYRQLSDNRLDPRRLGGDMVFGRGAADFLVDSPAAVGQAVLTRLMLWQGEWFLDLAAGTPWLQQVLGKPRGPGIPDQAIRAIIINTPYVTAVNDFAAYYNSTQRSLSISCIIDTAFGRTNFRAELAPPVPTMPTVPCPGTRTIMPFPEDAAAIVQAQRLLR